MTALRSSTRVLRCKANPYSRGLSPLEMISFLMIGQSPARLSLEAKMLARNIFFHAVRSPERVFY
jgi:hypothetical protein